MVVALPSLSRVGRPILKLLLTLFLIVTEQIAGVEPLKNVVIPSGQVTPDRVVPVQSVFGLSGLMFVQRGAPPLALRHALA
jgi:hypothetical protein